MIVTNSRGETLWHIQNMNICSDGCAYDMFVWSKDEPTDAELYVRFKDDYGDDDALAQEFAFESEINPVYAQDEDFRIVSNVAKLIKRSGYDTVLEKLEDED